MTLNVPKIEKILEIEEKNNIKERELLNIILILNTKTLSIIGFLLKKYPKEVLNTYIEILNTYNFLSKEHLNIIKKATKIKEQKKEIINNDSILEDIINHLNELTSSKRKLTEQRKKIINKWLNKGYSKEDFFKVNIYFNSLWKDNANMEQYIKPETLYNGKFENRLEEANFFFNKLNKYKSDIKEIFIFFETSYKKFITIDSDLLFLENLDKTKLILFWLEKYSKEDIELIIYKTIEQWSKKENLISFISLEKILDNKFPERFNVIKSKFKKNNESISALEDWFNS